MLAPLPRCRSPAHFTPLNVFRYPSFRMLASGILALLLGMIARALVHQDPARAPSMAPRTCARTRRKNTRRRWARRPWEAGSSSSASPFPTLLLADLGNRYVWFALLDHPRLRRVSGPADDYLKLAKSNSKGLSGKLKLAALTGVFAVAYALLWKPLRHAHLRALRSPPEPRPLGPYYPLFAWLVVVGTLERRQHHRWRLDGLAIGPTIVSRRSHSPSSPGWRAV